MIFASLQTIAILVNEFCYSGFNLCSWHLRLYVAIFIIHRVFMYAFVVWRAELLIRKRKKFLLRVVKLLLTIYGVLLVSFVFWYTNNQCNLQKNQTIMIFSLCVNISVIAC